MKKALTKLLSVVRSRGDVFLLLLCLAVSWSLYQVCAAKVTVRLPEPPPGAEAVAPKAQSSSRADVLAARSSAPVRFLMYNVRDYFVEEDKPRSGHARRIKTIAQREAVAGVISSVEPEIVGLVEIGGLAAIEDLAQRLARRGLEYPHMRVLTRWGEDRALGLLSKHPIVADHSVADCKLTGATNRRMLRGILDVSVQPEGDKRVFRIVGAHLKSHVGGSENDTESLRAREAQTVAEHVAQAAKTQPDARLVLYGDWNDGPKAPTLSVLTAGRGVGTARMSRLSPKDENGETWTIYYRDGNEYSAYDQILVNEKLSRTMGRKAKMGIVSQPKGTAAPSDHRAVWCDLY